jgi:Protein kinase domain
MNDDLADNQAAGVRPKGGLKRKKRKYGNKPKEAQEPLDQDNDLARAVPPQGPKYSFIHLAALILEDEIPILFRGDRRPRNSFAKLGSGGTFLVYAEFRTMANVIIQPYELRSLADNMVLKRTRPHQAVATSGNVDDARYAAIMAELQVLRDRDIAEHENFIDFMGLTWDFEQGSENSLSVWPVLALEAATCTLEDIIFQLIDAPLAEKIGYCYDVAKGLAFLYEKGVVHCDVKSENVLICVTQLSGSVAKLSDFGSAILDITPETCLPFGIVGTRPWNAPEYGRRLTGLDIFKTDIFSFGMLVWRSTVHWGLLTGLNDASEATYNTLLLKIENMKKGDLLVSTAIEELEQAYPSSEALQEVVSVFRKSLPFNPAQRDTMPSILENLQTYLSMSLESQESGRDSETSPLRRSSSEATIPTGFEEEGEEVSSEDGSKTVARITPLPETPFYNNVSSLYRGGGE